MEFKDYYSTLGVSKTSSEKEIKQAYRKLARKFHPDVNPGDKASESKFKEINEAYEVLGDPDKRKKYDELGANWRMYEQAGAQGGANPFAGGFNPGGGPAGRLPHDDAGRDGRDVRGREPVLRLLHHLLRRRAVAVPARGPGGVPRSHAPASGARRRTRDRADPRGRLPRHDATAAAQARRTGAHGRRPDSRRRRRRLTRAHRRRRRTGRRRRARRAICTSASASPRIRCSSARDATCT